MSVRHGSLLDRAPVFPRPQTATDFARKAQTRRLAETRLSNISHIASAGRLKAILVVPIGRFLDHAGDRQQAMRMRIADDRLIRPGAQSITVS